MSKISIHSKGKNKADLFGFVKSRLPMRIFTNRYFYIPTFSFQHFAKNMHHVYFSFYFVNRTSTYLFFLGCWNRECGSMSRFVRYRHMHEMQTQGRCQGYTRRYLLSTNPKMFQGLLRKAFNKLCTNVYS